MLSRNENMMAGRVSIARANHPVISVYKFYMDKFHGYKFVTNLPNLALSLHTPFAVRASNKKFDSRVSIESLTSYSRHILGSRQADLARTLTCPPNRARQIVVRNAHAPK